jgi:hypothetical protein
VSAWDSYLHHGHQKDSCGHNKNSVSCQQQELGYKLTLVMAKQVMLLTLLQPPPLIAVVAGGGG